jgi:quercetin dioxygenase-like cupin family protein
MADFPVLIESLTSNGGRRSVTRAVFARAAKAVLHYHTEYEETFHVIKGQLTVIKSGQIFVVNSGQHSPTIHIGEFHTYKNDSDSDVTVDIILEPGHAGCEAANNIVANLATSGKGAMMEKKYSIFWIAFYEITNTIPVGAEGMIYRLLGFFLGRRKIETCKRDLMKESL